MSFLLCSKVMVLEAINCKYTSLAVCSLIFKAAKFTKSSNAVVFLYIV